VSVALGNRMQARWAFSEMLRLARESNNRQLVRAAMRGQHAAERVAPRKLRALEQFGVTYQIFRGAAALTEAEGLYGREEELRRLLGQVTFVGTRFLTVWGETGCGKTSLVRAGLAPELERLGHYLPVVVHQWDKPELNVSHALERESKLPLEASVSLHDCIQHVAQQTGKTVVVICDQFEQFFTSHLQRSDRVPFLKAVGACVNDFRVSCKFVFVVREDHLGHLAEFDDNVPEPLEQRKRFYLPLFNATDAVRVLRQLSDIAGLGWSDAFIRMVVADLTKDERVRPIELQLVGAALAVSGINNDLDYDRAGRAQGLLSDYLELVLNSLSDREHSVQRMKRLLLVLVAEPAGRLTLSSEEIARRAGLKPDFVGWTLNRLVDAHLVRHVTDPLPAGRYELTHDVLVDLVLLVTRDLQDKRRQANRVLRRAFEDCTVNPSHTIKLGDWWLVKKHGEEKEIEKPQAKALLRRSLLWGVLKWFGLLPTVIILALAAVQYNSGYISLERDFAERVVIRRGLPWLGFLPILGDDVILDTGFTVDDFEREQLGKVNRLIHEEWGNWQSGVLEKKEFVDAIGPVQRGILWCQVGQEEKGIPALQKVLNDEDSNVRWKAAEALGQIAQAQAKPELAEKALNPLLMALKDENSNVRWAAAGAVADVLMVMAEKEQGPARFLLDHLEGRRSLMPNGDANTYAVYRDVVVGALAQWLVSDKPKAKAERAWLRSELERMRDKDKDKRLHLRIGAWNVFIEAAQLREKQEQATIPLGPLRWSLR
jgi:hypothetical protein